MVNTEKQLTDEIINFFREIFQKDKQGTAKEYTPCSMKKPFTEEEITIASKKLKMVKGNMYSIDNMYAEYIKYASGTSRLIITDILTKSVETYGYLEILKEGIRTPLQKPRKKNKKGGKKTKNLILVILLPTIRKISAICVIK